MKKIRFFSIIFISVLACLLVSCSPKEETNVPVEPDVQVSLPENDISDLPDENNDKTEDISDVVPEPVFYNKLTGLPTDETTYNTRPVAIMINNIKVSTPQQGISNADVIYEVLAEGGITRLLCLFTEYASLPETGSVRSSRDYYIDISDAHDAIYVHCGGSPAAYETLEQRKTENMDGIYFNTPFYRNEYRFKNMGYEHSLMTNGEKLVKGIEQKGYRTTSDAIQPFKFNISDTSFDGSNATYAKLVFTNYATSELFYDETLGKYTKHQYNKPHTDSNNNETLMFENILVFFCNQGAIKGDDKGRIAVDFIGDGSGYYMSDGKYKEIKWHKDSRTSSYTVFEDDSVTELLLNPGKTYIAIMPTGSDTLFE